MTSEYRIEELDQWIDTVHAGDEILLSGKLYTARDAVHKKWIAMLKAGERLPVSFASKGIYYAGSTPAPEGTPIGSCGPTTSSRMDIYYPLLANEGLRLTVGKGLRSEKVRQIITATKGIYLCAIGGAGALYASCVKESKVLFYEELGCEALRELTIEKFPLFVGIDAKGNSIFDHAKVN